MRAGLEIARPFNIKVREGARGRKNLEKTAAEWRAANQGRLAVIHSASAGEFEAAIPLITALKKKGMIVAATIYSPSGFKLALNNPEPDFVLYLPFDSKKSIRRFLQALKPDIFIFCKHDIWPNVVWECESNGIPTALVNANLHPNSFRLKPFLLSFNRRLFRSFSAIFTVSQDHARRLERIIGLKDIVEVVGDTRFDRVVSRALESEIKLPPSFEAEPVFIAGSVWETEKFTLETFLELHSQYPNWRLIWVPHEPHDRNIEKAQAAIEQAGISAGRFTNLDKKGDPQALLVDKVGVLPPLYRFADIAYVGGGFGKGVHSVIEPAVFSIPVIFGPHHFVSAEASELIKRGAGFAVQGRKDFYPLLNKLMKDETERRRIGNIAGNMVKEKCGVADNIADKLMDLLQK